MPVSGGQGEDVRTAAGKWQSFPDSVSVHQL